MKDNMRDLVGDTGSPFSRMTLTINTRSMPDTGGNSDSGDSSSDEGMFTPTSSTDSSPGEMADADSSPLLSLAAPMARDEEPTSTPSFAAPNPTTTNKAPGNLILDWEDSPEEGQGGAATPRPPHAPPPHGLIPLYPLYPVVPITADQAGMVDDLMSGPPGTPGPFSGQTPNFTIPITTYTIPANSTGQSPWNVIANANAQSAWGADDDGADDIEMGIFESRAQRQRELLEMKQIQDAIAASRAEMPDFIACSIEQERVMLAYAEDSSIPRPKRESKEDEEFFSELLPSEIEAEDEDIEDAIGNLDLEDQDGNDEEKT